MKIISSRILPPKGYTSINLFGIVFVRENTVLGPVTVNHEFIHTEQGKEMLWIFFYLWYLIEWGIRLIQYRNLKDAYRNISFERETNENKADLNYLRTRKRYAWWKYIK